MDKVLRLTFASSLTKLCEINSSFDVGVLRIAYAGQNRNGSFIAKETFEKCAQTMYNCPIVCNYNRETDTLGGHDMEVVRNEDGGLRLVNLTTPVGCIPESAKYWFETVVEDDGTEHEYFCATVLIWKRQEAYQKLRKDGIVAHSMEITVKSGHMVDGIFHITDFEFTAFALIGVTPCYEGSALELFSQSEFKTRLSEMMQELKECYQLVNTSSEDDNIHPQKFQTEGGEEVLEEKIEIVEPVEEKFEEQVEEPVETPAEELEEQAEEIEKQEPEVVESRFALNSNVMEELCRMLCEQTVQTEWGEWPRYCLADVDFDAREVYCWDEMDWLLYGFSYEIDGDNIIIDYDSKKRMKYVIVEWDNGEQQSPFASVYEKMSHAIEEKAPFEQKYQEASDQIDAMQTEIDGLKQFKADVEAEAAENERNAVFSQFEDLNGVEAFEDLREHAVEFDATTIEEKCFAIRGRVQTAMQFALKNHQAPKLVVSRGNADDSNEPYGGLFVEFGSKD